MKPQKIDIKNLNEKIKSWIERNPIKERTNTMALCPLHFYLFQVMSFINKI